MCFNFKNKKDILALVIRLIVGGVFIAVGWMKVSAMAQTIGFFATLGIPAFLAYIVGYAEFIGGILLVLGLWTDIVTAILAIIMIVAVYLTRSGGFQAYSMPLMTLAGLLSICATGADRYAIRIPCKKKISGATGSDTGLSS